MRVVNARTSNTLLTSNTVLTSNKQLAKGSGEVSQATETGNPQDRQLSWVVVGSDMVVEVYPCVSLCGALAIPCCVGSYTFKTILFLSSLLQIEVTAEKNICYDSFDAN